MENIVSLAPSRQKNKKSLLMRIWSYKYIYLLLVPAVVFYILFAYVPMYGIQIAFKTFSIGKGITDSPWNGLQNFQNLFARADFWNATKNTIVIALMKLLICFPMPILIAVLLNELRSRKLQRTLQTVFSFPHFLSWVTISGILVNFLGDQGFVNSLLVLVGLPKAQLLVNPQAFRWLIVITDMWKESGWTCIMYLAAMASIDPGLYESAKIDGANRLQRIWHITWPGIRDVAAVLLVLAVGNIMNGNFDQIFNMYSPTVYSTSDIIDTYIYRITFQFRPDYGLSTAVGLFKGVINCLLLVAANLYNKYVNHSTIF